MAPHATYVSAGDAPLAFSLPTDIIGLIADHFHGDKETLNRMALVSRQWLYVAQVELFYAFRVRAPSFKCTEKLADIVDNMQAHLASFVRTLTIEWGPFPSADDCIGPFLGKRELLVEIPLLFAVLQRMPALHTLTLNACKLLGTFVPGAPRHIQFLQKLTLVDVAGDPAHFGALLSRVQVADTIEMLDIVVSFGAAEEDVQLAVHGFHFAMISTRKLIVESKCCQGEFTLTATLHKFLLSSLHNITSLDAGSILSNDVLRTSLVTLLLERGHILRYLRLDAAYVDRDTHVLESINLAQCCPNLENLHIRVQAFFLSNSHTRGGVVAHNMYQFNDVIEFISTAPQMVRTVVIGLSYWKNNTSLIESVHFAAMEDVLSQFVNLQVLRLQAEKARYNRVLPMEKCATPLPESFIQKFTQRMSRTRSREMLQF